MNEIYVLRMSTFILLKKMYTQGALESFNEQH